MFNLVDQFITLSGPRAVTIDSKINFDQKIFIMIVTIWIKGYINKQTYHEGRKQDCHVACNQTQEASLL